MRTVLTLSRIGLVYSFCMVAIGIYNSYVWSERAYDVALEPANETSAAEVRVNKLKTKLYFARSKQGSNQVFSHGLAAVLFLSIAARVRRKESGDGNAP